jgi:hypothetical protein
VINSPQLVAMVDRNAQDLSFAPYLVQFAARALSPSNDAIRKLSKNLNGASSDPGLRIRTQKAMRECMAAGSETLNALSGGFLRQLAHAVGSTKEFVDRPVDLFYWVRDMVTLTSTSAVYGRNNPFLCKEVADGLW